MYLKFVSRQKALQDNLLQQGNPAPGGKRDGQGFIPQERVIPEDAPVTPKGSPCASQEDIHLDHFGLRSPMHIKVQQIAGTLDMSLVTGKMGYGR